ncbi:3,4-dihydroxy-2-butanone-4-phosphate synthase [Pseudodesulfovibrio cashew]|uniref:3,4-dihydroxy-2-butanone 4-phosphate synthase n=1 Tax=Pseudodesulfovibrio cashew TaxID=2678688 RepID=A0A6I6JK94_9BACT|nr:3,4-dihydroxy-2-butanone-4-phosphate synthase [Pseudodesulfovibrio cashew]QGY40537.1 3,4-dihydroxy-2-butanone-4-phosphate synthase [Pseudodesulfovibrio cashew]
MNQSSLLNRFGSSLERVENALTALREGRGILVTDNEDRENEGDLIFAAETLSDEQMALLIRECSGIVCLCLTDDKVRALGLPMMVEENRSQYQTAFTVSIEAAKGVTTGVSAADRVRTVKAAIAGDAKPSDIASPGHVFPLRARSGGVLERGGHTEATVDMARLAGLEPCGVLCELTNPDGTMARLPEIVAFADKHGMPVCTVDDIAAYRKAREAAAA